MIPSINHKNKRKNQNTLPIIVNNKINQMILQIIPTRATVFFCSFWVWNSSAIFWWDMNIKIICWRLVLIKEKSSKNSDFGKCLVFFGWFVIIGTAEMLWCPSRSMDRTQSCEDCNLGSTPRWGNVIKSKNINLHSLMNGDFYSGILFDFCCKFSQ